MNNITYNTRKSTMKIKRLNLDYSRRKIMQKEIQQHGKPSMFLKHKHSQHQWKDSTFTTTDRKYTTQKYLHTYFAKISTSYSLI